MTGRPEGNRSTRIGKIKAEKVHVGDNIYYSSAPEPDVPEKQTPLRVLLLGASPYDVDLCRIRADREFRAIRDAASEAVLHVSARPAARAADLRAVLDDPQPDVLHLCAHGNATTMVFETPDGAPHPVPVDTVVERMARYHDAGLRLRCIVLAMCDGAGAAHRFLPFAGTVVSWDGDIDDRCGVRFAAEFYRSTAPRPATTFGVAARLAATEVWGDDTLPCGDVVQRLHVVGD